MKRIDLNFSHQMEQRRHRRDLAIIVLAFLLLIFLSSKYQASQQQLTQHNSLQQTVTKQFSSPSISEGELRRQKLAQSLAASLNTPWYQMLDAIELVKQQHPDVYFKMILPDAKKGEILITGEVKQLEKLLGFIDGLNEQILFYDVLPLSQRKSDNENKNIEFSLKLRWQNND
jgi:hypothetical protein